METVLITYNLKDRGRKFRGKNRSYNIQRLCGAINGPECQERVKNRDMIGYYGHWPRIKFGLDPSEGGLEEGKPALIQPAIVTTYLKAYPDGRIEHKAEFLESDAGRLAENLYTSRVGGFSSVIDEGRNTFYGFDYVLEPNFTTNRGYKLSLDSAKDVSPEDVEAAIYGEQIRAAMALFDGVKAERDMAHATIEHLRAENEELLSLLSRAGIKAPEGTSFDSATMPIVLNNDLADRIRKDAEFFRAQKDLPMPAEGPALDTARVISPEEARSERLYQRMLRFGR